MGGATVAQADSITVHLFGMSFSLNPSGQTIVSNATIYLGDTLHFVWDSGTHTSTSVAGDVEVWNSGTKSNGSFDHTFTHTGKHVWYCKFHGSDNGDGTATGMSGAVIVVARPRFDLSTPGKPDLSIGKPDLLFHNSSTGALYCWFMNDKTRTASTLIQPAPSAGWRVAGVGDFNHDGKNDILLQEISTGNLSVYFMNGTTVIGRQRIIPGPGVDWEVVGTPDLNKDGNADILFQNKLDGAISCYLMTGATITDRKYIYPSVSTGNARIGHDWKVVGNGDFNGDGNVDIVFQNQVNGTVSCWFMNGISFVSSAYLSKAIPLAWKVVGAADFDGDGKPDLIFQNDTSGAISVWSYIGGVRTSETYIYLRMKSELRIVGLK